MGPGGKHSFNDGGQLFPGRPHLASDPLSPLRNGDFAAHHDGQQLLHLLSLAYERNSLDWYTYNILVATVRWWGRSIGHLRERDTTIVTYAKSVRYGTTTSEVS